MLLLTLSTYSMGKFEQSGVISVLILLVTALMKGHFILGDFMQLRGVSLLWRVFMYGWLWTICLVIAITYLIGL